MNKEEILMKYFDWNEENIERKANVLKNIDISEENILQKAGFFERKIGLTMEEFLDILKKQPVLLNYSEKYIMEKIKFYQKEFNLTLPEFVKTMKVLPALLCYSESSVKAKSEFYQKEFEIEKSEFVKIFKLLPAVLSFSEENVRKKVDFFKSELDIEKAEFVKILKVLPSILSYSEENVKAKYAGIKDINLSNNYIVKNPNILAVPANLLKTRYVILRQIAPRKDILARDGWFINNQNKTHARIMYLKDKGKTTSSFNVLCGEKKFKEKFGISSSELMEKYVLTPEEIERLESQYFINSEELEVGKD